MDLNIRRKRFLSFRIFQFFLVSAAAVAFPILFNKIHIAVTETISEHWRGGYDLLIRGIDSQSEIEKSSGLMDGNFLGEATYGITFEQLRQIQSFEDVEIAAPLAPIGYALNATQGIVFQLDDPKLDTVYRFSYRISGDKEQVIAENVVTCLYSGGPTGFDCRGADSLIGGGEDPLLILGGYFPVGWKLIAGIDPLQEDRLTGLSFSVPRSRDNRYLSENEKLLNVQSRHMDDSKSLEIPLIVNETAYVDQTLIFNSSSVRETSVGRFVENGVVNWTAVDELFAGSDETESVLYSIDLTGNITALNTQNVYLKPDGNISFSKNGFSFSSDTQLILLPKSFDYEMGDGESPALRIRPSGTWGKAVVPLLHELRLNPNYQDQPVDLPPETVLNRKLEVVRPPGFRLNVIGTYDFEKLNSYADPLSYVPLGIYQPPLARGEDGSELRPDLNPAGFIPQPAFGLTNLAAAKYLIGREDFISSIRVRVGGIDSYTPENVDRVQRVASQIRGLTGLRVDVVAGSSPREVQIDVPGVGMVWENWTTLGEAARITSGFNRINAFFFSLFALTAVFFLLTMAQLEVQNSRISIGVLKSVGWRRRDVISGLLRAQIAPFLIGFAFASLFGIIISAWQRVRFDPIGSFFVLFGFGVTLFLSAYLAIQRSAGQPPAVDFSVGAGAEDSAVSRSIFFSRSPIKSIFRLALNQLCRRPRRIVRSIFILSLSVFCAAFTIFVILNFHRQLTISLLGDRIGVEIGDAHLLIVWAMGLMSLLIVYAVLWMSVSERSDEYALFRAFGWERRTIFAEILIEGGAIGASGGVIGSVAGFAAFLFFTGAAPKLSMALSVLAVIAVATAASFCVAGVIAVRTVRWAGGSRSVEHSIHVPYPWMIPPRGSRIVLTLLAAVFAFGFSVFISDSDAPLNERIPWVSERIRRHAITDENVSGYRMMNHLNAIVQSGERIGGNEAEADAAEYIAAALKGWGFDVMSEPVPSNLLQVKVGNRMLELQTTGSFVHENRLKPGGTIFGEVVYLSNADELPPGDEIRGKIILYGISLGRPFTFADFAARFFETYEPEDVKAVFFVETDPQLHYILQNAPNLVAVMVSGVTISATLPGEKTSASSVLLYTAYDSNLGSPGANSGGTGSAVLMEIARRLAEKKPERTVRLVFLTSSQRKFGFGISLGPEGMIRYARNHADELRAYESIVSADQLGVWKNLLIASVVEPAEEVAKEELLNFYFERELSYQNLDAPVFSRNTFPTIPVDWDTVGRFLLLGERKGIDVRIEENPAACQTDVFHAQGIPAIGYCGTGDELAGTALDDMENIHDEQLFQAAALLYDVLFE